MSDRYLERLARDKSDDWKPDRPCVTCGEGTMWAKVRDKPWLKATELRCDNPECASFKAVEE